MNFIDASRNLNLEKKMCRKRWSGSYVILLPSQRYIWRVGSSNQDATINATIYSPSIDDILADDWIDFND